MSHHPVSHVQAGAKTITPSATAATQRSRSSVVVTFLSRQQIIDRRIAAENWHHERIMAADDEYRDAIDALVKHCKRHRFKPRQAVDCDDWKTECIYCGKTGRWL